VSLDFVAPREELSQGDLLNEAPAIFVRDLDYLVKFDKDRFRLQAARPASLHVEQTRHENAQGVRRLGMVLTHDCEIDKPGGTAPSLQLALVRRLAGVHEQHRAPIREGRQHRAFYLPAGGPLEEEHYADLRAVTTIRRDAADLLPRVVSLNDHGRRLLIETIFRFYTRRLLPAGWVDWEEENA